MNDIFLFLVLLFLMHICLVSTALSGVIPKTNVTELRIGLIQWQSRKIDTGQLGFLFLSIVHRLVKKKVGQATNEALFLPSFNFVCCQRAFFFFFLTGGGEAVSWSQFLVKEPYKMQDTNEPTQ